MTMYEKEIKQLQDIAKLVGDSDYRPTLDTAIALMRVAQAQAQAQLTALREAAEGLARSVADEEVWTAQNEWVERVRTALTLSAKK